MNLWLIFITGLTTGGLSCLAVQGGLLTSVITNQKESEIKELDELQQEEWMSRKERRKQTYLQALQARSAPTSFDALDWVPVTLFLVSKLIAYTMLGFFLGWIGGKLQLSITIRLLFQGIAALFMLGTAMNLLNVHPIFRYLVIQPPRFVRKWLKNSTRGKAFFTPALLGLMTVLIPCGVTQSMEVLAISTGNGVVGAAILATFVLGTSPVFAVIGILTAKLSETFQDKFMKVAALALIYLSVVSINGILVVLNAPITLGSVSQSISTLFSNEDSSKRLTAGATGNAPIMESSVQKVTIQVVSDGYKPNTFRVKAGIPVQLTVSTKESYSCASTFLMKAYGVKIQLAPTDSKTVYFTPTQPGEYPFNCSMGMYSGVMEVM